jgi:hypothetical protein
MSTSEPSPSKSPDPGPLGGPNFAAACCYAGAVAYPGPCPHHGSLGNLRPLPLEGTGEFSSPERRAAAEAVHRAEIDPYESRTEPYPWAFLGILLGLIALDAILTIVVLTGFGVIKW